MYSVANKLSLIIAILIIASFSLIGIIFYADFKQDYIDHSFQLKVRSLNNSINRIDYYIEREEDFMTRLSNDLSENSEYMSKDNANMFFEKISHYFNFDAIFITLESDGTFIRSAKIDGYKTTVTNNDFRNRDWYKEAVDLRRTIVSKPYRSIVSGLKVVTVSSPVIVNGKLLGVVGANFYFNSFTELLNDSTVSPTSSAILYDHNKEILVYSSKNTSFDIENFENLDSIFFTLKQSSVDNNLTYDTVNGMEVVCSLTNYDWILCITNSLSDYDKDLLVVFLKGALFTVLFTFIIISILVLILRKMLKPLKIIQYNLNQFFEFTSYKIKEPNFLEVRCRDEFGMLYRDLNFNLNNLKQEIFKDNNLVSKISAILENSKNGIFTKSIPHSSLNPALQELCIKLSDFLNVIGLNFENMKNILKQYSNNDFSKGIDIGKLGGGFKEVAISIEFLKDSIVSNLKSSLELSHSLTNHASKLDENIDILSMSSDEEAAALEQTSASIEEIISAMGGVNYMVEQSIESSKNIIKSDFAITDIVDQLIVWLTKMKSKENEVSIDEVISLAKKLKQSLHDIEDNANIVTQNIQDIGDSIREQALGISQINDQVYMLEKNTYQNVLIAKNSNEISQEVNKISNHLLQEISKHKF